MNSKNMRRGLSVREMLVADEFSMPDAREEPSTVNGTMHWFQSRMDGMLRLKGRSTIALSEVDQGFLLDFSDDPAKRRLFVYFDHKDEMRLGFSLPKGLKRKSIYMLKQRSFKLEEDGSLSGVLMGDVPPDILENLSTVSHELLYPFLTAGKLANNKEVVEMFHRFLSQVYLTVGQTQGKTLLPLPPRDPKWEEWVDQRSVKDKERVHVLESSVVTWTQQIKNVLRHEPPSFIHPGDRETGTAAEFVYWKGRAQDLSFIDVQLKSRRVQQVLRILESTKSTYTKPFQKLVDEVEVAREEAADVHLYLGPLQNLLESYEDVSLDSLEPMFKPAMHTIHLIYAKSKSFCTTARLQALLEKLGNDVIHAALKFVNGRTILDSDPEVVEARLKTTIELFGKLRCIYTEYKERSMESEDRQWLLQDELVFNLPDQFVERCYDMIDLVQMASSFGQLTDVQVGGDIRMARSIDQINSEFHEALRRIESTGYDLLDIAARKYNDDFFEFRRTVRDCERRLGSMISERMENFVTLGAAFNFLACFEVMLDRKIILDCLYEREVDLLAAVEAELQVVNEAFIAAQDVPPPFYNMPVHSSRVFWARSLADRIRLPMQSARRMLRNVMSLPESQEVIMRYDLLIQQLETFEREEISRWLQGIDSRLAEKLKLPLLVRDQGATKTLRLNFDSGVWSLLREAKYFYLLAVDVPEAVEVVYSKAEIYQQHAGNIQLIVNSYNLLLSSMADVELPLMLPKLEPVDEALEEGIEHLNWRNHSIASFIKKTTSYIADATNLLAMLKSSVHQICEMLRGWGTTSLHGTRKNTVGAEEYLQTYKASVVARLNGFRDEATHIHSLIAQIHMALQVSRGDPAWRKYVKHVNDMIVTTLRTSLIESLESIRCMIDPATRKEMSNALVEVRLELVAPQVLFFPDIVGNLSHNSLEDLVEYWITATLSIAKMLQRIDSGESNYYQEIADSPDVLRLVSQIRELSAKAFEMAQGHRSAYLEYSRFWMTEPAEEFSQFLATKVDTQGGMLEEFDKQIAGLKQVEGSIKALPNRETFIWISIDSKPMKQALFTLLSKWTFAYTNHLLKDLLEKTTAMSEFVQHANAGLKSFSDEELENPALSDIMGVITDVRKNSAATEEMFGPWQETIVLLQRYGVEVPTWVLTHVQTAPQIWNVLKKRMYQCRTMLEDTCTREQTRLRKESESFISRADAYRDWFEFNMPFNLGQNPDPDMAYGLIDSQRHMPINGGEANYCLESILVALRELNMLEELFDLKQTTHDGLQQCSIELVHLKHVWDLAYLFIASFNRWNEVIWFGVDLESLVEDIKRLTELVEESQDHHEGWPIYESMKDRLRTSLEAVHLMNLLQSPVLRQRHWKQLLRLTGGSLLNETDIKLGDLFALNLPAHSHEVEELVKSAEKECEIEARLQVIEEKWSQLTLTFTHSDTQKWVLQPQDGMMNVLHEALVELQNLSFNTNVAKNSSFSELVRTLHQQLSGAESLLSIWILAQHKHATLHALFSSAVSRSHCGDHADAFEQTHSSWKHMMSAAAALPSLQETCAQEDRHKQVKALLNKMEDSQAKLLSFLDEQRSAVPRFYMLSNEALLVLLSLEGHPNECMPYIRQLFPGLQELGIEFRNGGENQAFTSMRGRHGERVSLTHAVLCDGAVQKWVTEVEQGINDALKAELGSMALSKQSRNELWLVTPALQLAATLVSIEYCADIEACLAESADSSMLKAHKDKLANEAAQLAAMVRRQEIADVERNKLSAMITHTGVWHEIVDDLCSIGAGGGGLDQFEWQSNLRLYIHVKKTKEVRGDKIEIKCNFKLCTITKDYGFSYVGDDFTPLVRTSAVHAAQMALITAHHFGSGGWVRGPPSSGKLETVRCTANAIGIPCIIVQSHSSFTHRWLAATVSGVAHMGAWLLLRNAETLPTSILSHLAQLYSAVLSSIKQGSHPKKPKNQVSFNVKSTLELEPKGIQKIHKPEVDVHSHSDQTMLDGVYITVHPHTLLLASSVTETSASHRTLPETLALLLRPATTHSFDPLPVAIGWLYAKGFGECSPELGAILVRFCDLCCHALSPARHYDWGLRTIKRVLYITNISDTVVSLRSSSIGDHPMPEPSLQDALGALGRACIASLSTRLRSEDEHTFRALIEAAFFYEDDSDGEGQEHVLPTTDRLHKLFSPGTSSSNHSRKDSSTSEMSMRHDESTASLIVNLRERSASLGERQEESRKGIYNQRGSALSMVERQEDFNASVTARTGSAARVRSMPQVVADMGFQPYESFVMRALQLNESLSASRTAFVTGPVGCGKTALVQVCARKPPGRPGQAAVVRAVSPRMMTVDHLFGYMDVSSSMRWVDGVLSTIFRDMAAAGEGDDVPQQWLVLDGCMGGEWPSMVERALHEGGELILSSQERVRATNKMRVIFECDTLNHASPSLISHGNVLYMRDTDVGWYGYTQSWLSKSLEGSSSSSAVAKLLGNGEHDLIPRALAFIKLECSFVATVNQLTLVETVTTILTATQTLRGEEVQAEGKGIVAPPQDVFESPSALRTLCFALMWGFGAMLKTESCPKFSAWLRAVGEEHHGGLNKCWAGLPAAGLVWDYFPEMQEGGGGCTWKSWAEHVPEFKYIWSSSQHEEPDTIVVQTVRVTSTQHYMRMIYNNGRPLLIMGGPGVGKTQVARDFMAGLDLEVVTRCCVTLCGATGTDALQNALEVPLEGRSGKNNAPSGGNAKAKVCYFIDDLHLPLQDAQGEQPALELLRHVLDRGHWFDRDLCSERIIHKCSFITSMSPSHVATASRARLIRHFSPVFLDNPHPEELQHIYESLTMSFFTSLEVPDLPKLSQPLVRCTIKQFTDLASVLMPSHEKPHYLLSQHEIAKIFHGLFANPAMCTSPLQTGQLWFFLCKSTFMGRLVSQDDCNMCLRIIMNSIDALNEHIDADAMAKAHRTFICVREGVNPAAIRTVQPGQQLTDVITKRIDSSGPTVSSTEGAPSDEDQRAWAALYGDVLTRVTVALHHPGGHIHLAGPGGSGKYTVAKAAAVLCGLHVVDLHVASGPGEASLKSQLCSVFWDSGVGKINQALLLPSHIPATHVVLGLLSDALAPSGFAQMIALFPAARQNDIYAALRGDVRKQGLEDSRENCWVLFNNQVHKHLRVVVTGATNDVGKWGARVMSFPLLIARMTVVWLGALPPDKTHSFGIPYLTTLLDKELQEERPDLVSQVSRHLTLVHQAAADFLQRPQPPDPPPPLSAYPSVSFTWYAQTWTSIYKKMRDDIREKSRRANIAAEKLEAELTRLSDLEAAIEDQRQVVEQKKIVANRLLANVGQETALLNEQKVILEDDIAMEKRSAVVVRNIQEDIRRHLEELSPFAEMCALSIEKLELHVLNEIKGLVTPTDGVLVTLRCILVLLTPQGKPLPLTEALAWKELRKLLNKPDSFAPLLAKSDVKNMSKSAIDMVEESYMCTPAFKVTDRESERYAVTIEGLKDWIITTVRMFHLEEKLKPKQADLQNKEAAYNSAKAKYLDLLNRVKNLEIRLGDVMGSFQDATEEKNAAMMRLDELTASCGIARRLALCLAGGRANRLQQAKERYKQQMDCLLGDSLTAAAFVSFAGALGGSCRDSFIRYQVLADLRAQKVQVSSGPVLSLFVSPFTAADWQAMGLPDDQYYLESACIALNSTAWPVLVDPEGVGLRWLTALYAKQGVGVLAMSNQSNGLLKKLRACIVQGTPMVITGPLAGLDPDMMCVASRRFYTHHRTVVVDLGGEVLEVHPQFRLFFSTGLGRVDFCEELSYIASVVSFTGSDEAVRQRALWCVVGYEAPRIRDTLLDMHARRRTLLGDKERLEASMLHSLSEEEGMVLSDGLAARLSEDLGAADALDEALSAAAKELAAAEYTMKLFEPVARRGALLMQVATRLIRVSPMCAFSAPALLEAIEEGVKRSARTVDDEILQLLMQPRFVDQLDVAEEESGKAHVGGKLLQDEESQETRTASNSKRPLTAKEIMVAQESQNLVHLEASDSDTDEAAKEEEYQKRLLVVRESAMRCMRGVTETVTEVVGAAMDSKDRNTYSALVAIAVFLDAVPESIRAEKQEVLDLYLTMPTAKAYGTKSGTSPFPSWLPDSAYSAIIHFAKIKRGSPLKNVGNNLREAKIICESPEPELIPPDQWPAQWGLDELERWVALCALRPDRAVRGAHEFASSVLAGRLPLEPPALESLMSGHAANRPLLIVLPHSSDLFDMQESLMHAVGGGFERAIVDGTNDNLVSAAVDSAMDEGRTILVHSPELSVNWQRNYLDPLLDHLSAQGSDGNAQLKTPSYGFRLVLCVVASNPSLDLSRDTLACCIKVRLEAPLQLEPFRERSAAALKRTVAAIEHGVFSPSSPTTPHRVPSLPTVPIVPKRKSVVHSISGKLPSPSAVTPSDVANSAHDANVHKESRELSPLVKKGDTSSFEYEGLVRQMSLLHAVMRTRALHGHVGLSASGLCAQGGIMYALGVCMKQVPPVPGVTGLWAAWGSITQATWMGPEMESGGDRRVMSGILSQLMCENGGQEAAMDGCLRLGVGAWSMKNLDVTEGFTLQRDIGEVLVQRRKREISRMDKAKMALDEIQERLPRTMPLPVVAQGSVPDLFYFFLLREVTRMRRLMDAVWSSLVDIEQVLEGHRHLNPEQEALIQSMYFDHVPTAWARVAYPSLRPLGAWFADLVVRSDTLAEWQRQGVLPPSVWMGGLFSPDGLVATAITQHALQMTWPISKVQVHMDVTRKTADEIALGASERGSAAGRDGVLVHGLFLEAAGWDVRLGVMEELKPAQGPREMPVMLLRIALSDHATENMFSVPLKETPKAYNCPVYRTQSRGDTLVMSGVLMTKLGEQAWVRAGVAMVLDPYTI